jgi:hypothetical protein
MLNIRIKWTYKRQQERCFMPELRLTAKLTKDHFGQCIGRSDNLARNCAGPRADSENSGQILSNAVSIGRLGEAKRAALRRGIWYRALNLVERGVIDLTVKFVDSVRSAKLANVLTAIMDKLELAMENTADRLVRLVGYPLAQKISHIATSWGNRSAFRWAEDRDFARYLAMNFQVKHAGI